MTSEPFLILAVNSRGVAGLLQAASLSKRVFANLGTAPEGLHLPDERADELDQMRRLVREALDAGAAGLSTSRQPAHQGAFGRPVPSRFAEIDEVSALAGVLGEAGRGILQVSIGPGLFVNQFSELAVRHGIPVTWTALVARADKPGPRSVRSSVAPRCPARSIRR